MITYLQQRPHIQSGDVIAFTHKSWHTLADIEIQAVRFFTQSEFSHVGISWVVVGRIFILEAVVPAIRIFPLSLCGNFYHIPMDKELSEEALEYALDQVGEVYSKTEAIKAFFGKEKDDDQWECAEYVHSVLEANGILLMGKATPTGVVNDLLEIGKSLSMVTA